MTIQDYTRYTGSAYMHKYTTREAAIKAALSNSNRCKVKIVMLEDGIYGVAQNKIANKFIQAGYEAMPYTLSDI